MRVCVQQSPSVCVCVCVCVCVYVCSLRPLVSVPVSKCNRVHNLLMLFADRRALYCALDEQDLVEDVATLCLHLDGDSRARLLHETRERELARASCTVMPSRTGANDVFCAVT